MTERQIRRFFQALAGELKRPVRVTLTGAAAGALLGSVRPSLAIDFQIEPAQGARGRWDELEVAIGRAVQLTGIQANFAQDIDRWGAISLLDYRRHTRPYATFGRLRVRLLDPRYWAIGKLSRYLDPDVQDLVAVLKRQRPPVAQLARLWGRALAASPRSSACTQFRAQVEHFLRTYGPAIWGPGFNADMVIQQFHEAAGKR